ncbi:hypothetical protein GCM10009834_00590 [Streptomonospora arabica]
MRAHRYSGFGGGAGAPAKRRGSARPGGACGPSAGLRAMPDRAAARDRGAGVRERSPQLKESPQAQEPEAFGLSIVKPCFSMVSTKSILAPMR